MSASIPASHRPLLDRPIFASLGTIRPDATVQVNPMWFEFDGEHLRFTHTNQRGKFRNLQHNPSMSLLLIDEEDPLRYLELRGRLVDVDRRPDRRLLRPPRPALRQPRPAAAAGQGRPRHPRHGRREANAR